MCTGYVHVELEAKDKKLKNSEQRTKNDKRRHQFIMMNRQCLPATSMKAEMTEMKNSGKTARMADKARKVARSSPAGPPQPRSQEELALDIPVQFKGYVSCTETIQMNRVNQ